jgi:hypothetical protein
MCTVSADQVAVGVFQILLLFVLLYAIRRDKGWFMPPSALEGSKIQRGKESWEILIFAYTIVTVNVLQIIGSSNAFPNCKALLGFIDLVAMLYLFFFNGWFRNWTLKVVGKAKSLEEPVR